jgi:hypothetical protein
MCGQLHFAIVGKPEAMIDILGRADIVPGFSNLGTRCKCVQTFKLLPLYSRRKSPRCPLASRRLGIWSARFRGQFSVASGIEPRPFGCVVRSLVTIPSELYVLSQYTLC